jgi:hypothetical protein
MQLMDCKRSKTVDPAETLALPYQVAGGWGWKAELGNHCQHIFFEILPVCWRNKLASTARNDSDKL